MGGGWCHRRGPDHSRLRHIMAASRCQLPHGKDWFFSLPLTRFTSFAQHIFQASVLSTGLYLNNYLDHLTQRITTLTPTNSYLNHDDNHLKQNKQPPQPQQITTTGTLVGTFLLATTLIRSHGQKFLTHPSELPTLPLNLRIS